MSFGLGRQARQWNEIAAAEKAAFSAVKREHLERLSCVLMEWTTASELRVLLAITARTVRFKKAAEAIPLQQFTDGLRDEDGDLLLDDFGEPYFAGTGIAKTDTVSAAVAGLEAKGLITRWPRPRTNWATVYMPFSEHWLAETLAAQKAAIAPDYERFVPLEYLKHDDGFVRVMDVTGQGLLVCPVGEYLHEQDVRHAYFIPADQISFALERPTPSELQQMRRPR